MWSAKLRTGLWAYEGGIEAESKRAGRAFRSVRGVNRQFHQKLNPQNPPCLPGGQSAVTEHRAIHIGNALRQRRDGIMALNTVLHDQRTIRAPVFSAIPKGKRRRRQDNETRIMPSNGTFIYLVALDRIAYIGIVFAVFLAHLPASLDPTPRHPYHPPVFFHRFVLVHSCRTETSNRFLPEPCRASPTASRHYTTENRRIRHHHRTADQSVLLDDDTAMITRPVAKTTLRNTDTIETIGLDMASNTAASASPPASGALCVSTSSQSPP